MTLDSVAAARARTNQLLQERAQRIAAGELCSRCGGYIVARLRIGNGEQVCIECRRMREAVRERITHERLVRCPACAHQFAPEVGWEQQFVDEHGLGGGALSLACAGCGESFLVRVLLTPTFWSPPLMEGVQ